MAKLSGEDREKALHNGQITDHPPKIDEQIERARKRTRDPGAVETYAEVIADRTVTGGKRRINRREAVDRALERLEPKALKVLEQQLKSPDERVKQNAAIRILEWARGKPGSSVSIQSEHTHTIKYETVAFAMPPVRAELELPPENVIEENE